MGCTRGQFVPRPFSRHLARCFSSIRFLLASFSMRPMDLLSIRTFGQLRFLPGIDTSNRSSLPRIRTLVSSLVRQEWHDASKVSSGSISMVCARRCASTCDVSDEVRPRPGSLCGSPATHPLSNFGLKGNTRPIERKFDWTDPVGQGNEEEKDPPFRARVDRGGAKDEVEPSTCENTAVSRGVVARDDVEGRCETIRARTDLRNPFLGPAVAPLRPCGHVGGLFPRGFHHRSPRRRRLNYCRLTLHLNFGESARNPVELVQGGAWAAFRLLRDAARQDHASCVVRRAVKQGERWYAYYYLGREPTGGKTAREKSPQGS